MQTCRVYWRDRSGVEHGVRVQAVNRYHAFGLAMFQLRKCSWSNLDYSGVTQMTIRIEDGKLRGKSFTVTRQAFEDWLTADPKPAALGNKLKEYLRMLLGRIPPDRDFINGRKAH